MVCTVVVPVLACELAAVIDGYDVVGKGFSRQKLQCVGRAMVMFLEPPLSPSKSSIQFCALRTLNDIFQEKQKVTVTFKFLL